MNDIICLAVSIQSVSCLFYQDTDAPTRCLLEENGNFGMSQTQIKFIRQEKVGEGGMNAEVLPSNP